MATAHQHAEKAEHHIQFLATITDAYPDWLATVAFYAAVELVEGFLAERGVHSFSHEERRRSVRRNCPSIHHAYAALYNASLDARYQDKERWLGVAEVRSELIARRLKHIQSFVASHARGGRS